MRYVPTSQDGGISDLTSADDSLGPWLRRARNSIHRVLFDRTLFNRALLNRALFNNALFNRALSHRALSIRAPLNRALIKGAI